MRIDWGLALLKSARWLVPGPVRAEWLAEWQAELWYVRRSGASVTRFCLGAFPDAVCLRRQAVRGSLHLESPTHCLLLLAVLAAASLFLSFYWPVHRDEFFPSSKGPDPLLVEIAAHRRPSKVIPSIPYAQYQAWMNRMPPQFTALAFYDRLPDVRRVRLTSPPLSPTPSVGFVIARMRRRPVPFGHISLPTKDGPYIAFDYRVLAPRVQNPFGAVATMSVIAWLLLRVTPISSPAPHKRRLWLFLAAKLVLALPVVVFGALDLGYLAGKPLEGPLLMAGWFVSLRWVLRDQRRRCPVCLRLLINPVGIGQASQTFLGWYGTELMCDKGHGMLHVPEIPGSSSSPSRWVQLDPSWSGLF